MLQKPVVPPTKSASARFRLNQIVKLNYESVILKHKNAECWRKLHSKFLTATFTKGSVTRLNSEVPELEETCFQQHYISKMI